MITIGTSGFDYADWRGFFYPEKLPKTAWLEYYSRYFSSLELNFSYYRMPSASNLESMVKRTDGKVKFSIKCHRSMTHERIASDLDYDNFNEALKPVRESSCLGAVLAQFPNSFTQCEENRSYLKKLADLIGRPLAVEFRRIDWYSPTVLEWLRKINVGFVCVDEPKLQGLMPPAVEATSSFAYVRFHGRNSEKWYSHNRPEERYDYRYTISELSEWSGKIKLLERKAGHVLVFFNNHFQGKAVESAKAMEYLLKQI